MQPVSKYLCVLISVLLQSAAFSATLNEKDPAKITFRENKGQVSDQNYRPRPDVLFSGSNGQLDFHLKNTGISYQLKRIDSWKKRDSMFAMCTKRPANTLVPDQVTVYRLDVEWLNANTSSEIIKENPRDGVENFYTTVCPNGVTGVQSFGQVTYQQLYAGIDLKWYSKNGNLKYDYLVAPGADYRQIQLKINGAESLTLNSAGELIIKTPLGELTEQAPLVTQNGRTLPAKWIINGNTASFEIKNVDASLPLVIDPLVRLWATYYGGLESEQSWSLHTDAAGNVYMPGETTSLNNIATTGAHQVTYNGSGGFYGYGDAFVVKFNSAGVRLWATYYGGSEDEFGSTICTDVSGNVYMVGTTSSSNAGVISTPGAHQANLIPPASGTTILPDGFIVKFNSAGVRQWGTYYGGGGWDWAEYCSMDINGDLYFTGTSSSISGIATPGAHQPVFGGGPSDGFLVKFNSSGTRLWSTYYGGSGILLERGGECKTDVAGNVFLSGYCSSPTGIATPGSHQTVFLGNNDGYLVKFNGNGIRQWGTYYGGAGNDMVWNITLSPSGDIYMAGSTTSTIGISTPGSHQPVHGGGTAEDVFLAKFNAAGVRQWATYYGGLGVDNGAGVIIDPDGNVYIAGTTATSTGTSIATPCTYQLTYGGGSSDAFLAKFTSNGTRLWGTYYGGPYTDNTWECRSDPSGNIYMCGYTLASAGTVFATPNSHQPNYGGGLQDAFLAKFNGCKAPPDLTTPPNKTVCAGKKTTLTTTTSTCGINWYSAPGGTVMASGNTLSVSPVVTSTYYIGDVSCGLENNLTPVTVTVIPLPNVSAAASQPAVCSGNTVSLTASGAGNYTWQPNGDNSAQIIVSPTASAVYSLTGNDGTCSKTTTVAINVVQYPVLNTIVPQGPYCYGSTVAINASGAPLYYWQPLGMLSANNGTSVVTNSLAATTVFTLVGQNSGNGAQCYSDKLVSLEVLPTVIPTISNSVTLCEGTKTGLVAGGAFEYHWEPAGSLDNPDIPNVIAEPKVTTVYTVSIAYNKNCPAYATVLVKVEPKPDVHAGNDTVVNIGDPVIISAKGTGVLKWISGDKINCRGCAVTNVYPTENACYVVEATDEKGCRAQDDVCIEIRNDFGLYIPNTFTPNEDGVNDVFYAYGFGIKELSMTIYDRWGNKLFATDDPQKGWDGYYKGEVCEQATYIYQIRYSLYTGKSESRTGHVNIIR